MQIFNLNPCRQTNRFLGCVSENRTQLLRAVHFCKKGCVAKCFPSFKKSVKTENIEYIKSHLVYL